MNPVIGARPRTPCVRCNKTHDTPAAFLMSCCKCERAWHHTCHIPPVTEQEILDRLKADESGKRGAGLAAWQCRRCTKRKRIEPPVIEVDDDIEVVESGPRPPSARRSEPLAAQALASVPDSHRVQEMQLASPHAPGAEGLPPEAALPRASWRDGNLTHSSSRRAQKRPTKRALVITPLPSSQERTNQPHPRTPLGGHPERRDSPPRVDAQPSVPLQPPSSHAPVGLPPPPPRRSPVSAKDIRELISSMRASGQLQPPPVVDYVLSRPGPSQKPPTGSPSVPERGSVESRSRIGDLEDVERKLEDFADEPMDVDPIAQPSPAPEPEPEPAPDEHNIDDLYGDIAPRYRDDPPPAPRAMSTAATQDRLLFAVQRRRAEAKGHPPQVHVANPEVEHPRRPRKFHAQQLKGKALRKKQAAGVVFIVGEVDWRRSAE